MNIKPNERIVPAQFENIEQSDSASSADADARAGSGISEDVDAVVNYPNFVSGLIEGTFQGVVDSSIQQMDDYAGLVKNVVAPTDSIDTDGIDFTASREHISLTKDDDDK